MTDKFSSALQEAVQEIAETMLFVEISPAESTCEKSTIGADISAVIGYSSALKGSMRLAGPLGSVMKLASALLGEERDALDKEMEDAFAELANMIAGGVQTRMEAELGIIRMSPPVIISGKNHQVSSDRSFSCISNTFILDGQPFFTEIYYSEQSLKAGEVDNSDKYGFSLSVPMPSAKGFSAEAEPTPEVAHARVDFDVPALAVAIREAFTEQVTTMAHEIAREMVQKLLPELAEQMVRAEIERIKREGI